jgi:hypothetical protein
MCAQKLDKVFPVCACKKAFYETRQMFVDIVLKMLSDHGSNIISICCTFFIQEIKERDPIPRIRLAFFLKDFKHRLDEKMLIVGPIRRQDNIMLENIMNG